MNETPPLEYGWMSQAVYARLDDAVIAAGNEFYQSLFNRDWDLVHFVPVTESGYQGGVFVHHGHREVVVAHGGTSLDRLRTFVADNVGVIQNKLHQQITDALQHQASADKTILELLTNDKYQLTFTGHSLGGFLATLCLYFCQRQDLQHYYPASRAVVFDPAGSQDMMEQLEPHATASEGLGQEGIAKLNIVHFLSYPNYVNAFRPHPGGTKYALTSEVLQNSVVSLENDVWGYLMQTHKLENILAAFDVETGYPLREHCRIAADWPLINLTDLQKLKTQSGIAMEALRVTIDYLSSWFNRSLAREQAAPSRLRQLLGGGEFQRAARLAIYGETPADLREALLSRWIFLDDSYDCTLKLCHFSQPMATFLGDLAILEGFSPVETFFTHHDLAPEERALLLQIETNTERGVVKLPPEAQKTIFEFRDTLNELAFRKPTFLKFRDFLRDHCNTLSQTIDTLRTQGEEHQARITKLEALLQEVRQPASRHQTVAIFSALTCKRKGKATVDGKFTHEGHRLNLEYADKAFQNTPLADHFFGSAFADEEEGEADVKYTVGAPPEEKPEATGESTAKKPRSGGGL